jgi:hypothetical protein
MKLKEIISEEVANILQTSVVDGHYHFAKVNDGGSGRTTMIAFTTATKGASHKHKIKNWKALEVEGHTHEIKKSARAD